MAFSAVVVHCQEFLAKVYNGNNVGIVGVCLSCDWFVSYIAISTHCKFSVIQK